MRKVAVFADVHANLAHLDAMLAQAHRCGVTEYWCLGDFVTDGDDPVAVFERVIDVCGDNIVLGNHEKLILDKAWRTRGDTAAVNARIAADALGEARLRILRALRFHRDQLGGLVEMVHSHLGENGYAHPEGFIDDERQASLTLERAGDRTRVVLTGHTHVPGYFVRSNLTNRTIQFTANGSEQVQFRELCNVCPGAVSSCRRADRGSARWLELWTTGGIRGIWRTARITA